MKLITEKMDLNDINAYFGLVILGLGLRMISVPLALCVVGGLLFILGILGAIRKGGS